MKAIVSVIALLIAVFIGYSASAGPVTSGGGVVLNSHGVPVVSGFQPDSAQRNTFPDPNRDRQERDREERR